MIAWLIVMLHDSLILVNIMSLNIDIIGLYVKGCLTVWGNSSKQNLSSIQKLQNRAARAITGNYDFTTSVSGLIKQLSWMNIHQRLSYFLGILVFKCLNNQAPTYLTDFLNYVTDHQTRHTLLVVFQIICYLYLVLIYLFFDKAFTLLDPLFGIHFQLISPNVMIFINLKQILSSI